MVDQKETREQPNAGQAIRAQVALLENGDLMIRGDKYSLLGLMEDARHKILNQPVQQESKIAVAQAVPRFPVRPNGQR